MCKWLINKKRNIILTFIQGVARGDRRFRIVIQRR